MVNVTEKFKKLVRIYSTFPIQFETLRAVTVAQWMHESGRGGSLLFQKHNNAFGMKYRPELSPFAFAVKYGAHDGIDTYAEFHSLSDAIKGYWTFINRSVYDGWENHAGSGYTFLKYIFNKGYATDPNYVEKVLRLLPEAEELLNEVNAKYSVDSVSWLCMHKDSDTWPCLVAYQGSKPVVKLKSKIKDKLIAFANHFPNAQSVLVSENISPNCPDFDSGELIPTPETQPESERVPLIAETFNSPNQSERNATISMIVLHNTAGSFNGAVSWLCNKQARASAHFVISRSGKIVQLVGVSKKAWHAGNSRVNACSIGIELEAYEGATGMTKEMDKACRTLVRWLMGIYQIDREDVGIHRWYRRTSCPGLIWPTDTEFKEWRSTL